MHVPLNYEHSPRILDNIINILRVANGVAEESYIIRRCNLSFTRLRAYLDFLVDMSLLESINPKTRNKGDSPLFKTTGKGKAFLKDYHNLKALLTA